MVGGVCDTFQLPGIFRNFPIILHYFYFIEESSASLPFRKRKVEENVSCIAGQALARGAVEGVTLLRVAVSRARTRRVARHVVRTVSIPAPNCNPGSRRFVPRGHAPVQRGACFLQARGTGRF